MDRNDFKEKIENEVIYKVFSANVPMAVYEEQFKLVDTFCKENFMDNRWSMIWNLVVDATEDYKYKMLYDELMQVKAEVVELKEQPKEQVPVKKLKTFGRD